MDQHDLIMEETKCDHGETRLVSRVHSNNAKHYGQQCQRCGVWVRSVRKATIPVRELLTIPSFDKDLKQEWSDHCSELWDNWREEQKREREEQGARWWRNYQRYLSSERWLDKRQKVLERDNHKCQACQERRAIEVHHLSYRFCPVRRNGHLDKSFSEPLFDLISLCSKCHRFITEMRRKS